MCFYWYYAEHFSELSYRFFLQPKGHILDELRVSFNIKELLPEENREVVSKEYCNAINFPENFLYTFLKEH